MSRTVLRLLILGVLLGPVPAALAQTSGGGGSDGVKPGMRTAPEPGSGALRDFTLRNQSDQAIVEAQVGTTGGHGTPLTTQGQIATNHSQNFHMRKDDCVDSVTVKFRDGRTLKADGLNDCRAPEFVVSNDRIAPTSQAKPGTAPSLPEKGL